MQRTTTPTALFNLNIFSPPHHHHHHHRSPARDSHPTDPGPVPPSPANPAASRGDVRKASFSASISSRKASFSASISSRKASFSAASPFRRSSAVSPAAVSFASFVTDPTAPPALPDYALSSAAKVQQGLTSPRMNMPSRTQTTSTTTTTASAFMPPPTPLGINDNPAGGGGGAAVSSSVSSAATVNAVASSSASSIWQPSEASMIHQQITELANKRISTLDYLRKAHEGRVYWFNTYLFDRPDLARMPYFDPRKLARRATNFLLLGLSVPTINDLYSSSAIEFLRCLNALLSEFDSFQQLHGDSSATLTRARLPNMFRRPGGKSRRSASAADFADESQSFPAVPGGANGGAPSVMTFAASESDLLPGEEYTYLLTPSLPFEPDFFETFATLCDVLIDSYTRFLTLVPTPRECSSPVADLFSKADARLRKIIVQGAVKEFEDHSRSQVKAEVASIGKVVLGGLM